MPYPEDGQNDTTDQEMYDELLENYLAVKDELENELRDKAK